MPWPKEIHTLERSRKESDSLGDYLSLWVDFKSPSWQFKTIERVKLDINKFIIPELGEIKLCDLTAEYIEKAYVSILRNHGISDSSLLHIHSTLRTALNRAVKLKRLAVNPLFLVKAQKQRVADH